MTSCNRIMCFDYWREALCIFYSWCQYNLVVGAFCFFVCCLLFQFIYHSSSEQDVGQVLCGKLFVIFCTLEASEEWVQWYCLEWSVIVQKFICQLVQWGICWPISSLQVQNKHKTFNINTKLVDQLFKLQFNIKTLNTNHACELD